MRWKRAIIISLIVIAMFVDGCLPQKFSRITFLTESTTNELPKEIPQWWRNNLDYYIRLSYLEDGESASFGLLLGDVFKPDLYTTYAVTGILSELNIPIEDSSHIINWITSLQNNDGSFYDKNTLASTITQTYWAISVLKRLNSSFPSFNTIYAFLKDHQLNNGLFLFDNNEKEVKIEDCISQTYFVVSILRLLGQKFEDENLSNTLKQYIEKAISSYPSLLDEQSGYLISAIEEFAFLNKNLVPLDAYKWASDKFLEVDSLPYGVPYIALINNLLEVMKTLDIPIKDRSKVNSYLMQKVFPNQNLSGGISFYETKYNFMEPMLTYLVVRLYKQSSLNKFPNADKLTNTIDAHRIKEGWIKFITFEPDIESTFYALYLAKLNGSISDYPKDKFIKYIKDSIEEIEKTTKESIKVSDGIKTVDYGKVFENIKNLYFLVRTYVVLNKNLPSSILNKVVNIATSLVNNLPETTYENLFTVSDALFYFAYTFNSIGLWPNNSPEILERIKNVRDTIVNYVKDGHDVNIRLIYDFFMLETVSSAFNSPLRDTEGEIIMGDILQSLSNGNGFKRNKQMSIPDINSTYLGLMVESISGNLKINIDDTINFVFQSMCEYGFRQAPSQSCEASEIRATYEALWILSYLKVGLYYNYGFSN